MFRMAITITTAIALGTTRAREAGLGAHCQGTVIPEKYDLRIAALDMRRARFRATKGDSVRSVAYGAFCIRTAKHNSRSFVYEQNQSATRIQGANMPLITIVVTVVVVGAGLWAINTYIPMARPVKTILNVVVVAVLCLWLLQAFGLIDSIKSIRVR
jgi:hypothetical protein